MGNDGGDMSRFRPGQIVKFIWDGEQGKKNRKECSEITLLNRYLVLKGSMRYKPDRGKVFVRPASASGVHENAEIECAFPPEALEPVGFYPHQFWGATLAERKKTARTILQDVFAWCDQHKLHRPT